ncbi:MAG: sigma-70 family RNA polymerase sigma factor [Pirellulales bacterium]|nr:sigma-70 family RNA polymerase sigma factor [Pirellulales bacterium]
MSASDSAEHREFVGLLLKAQPKVYALLRTLIANRADADDVFQDVVTVLWTKFDEFEPGTNFEAWAYQTARYKVQQYYRTRRRDAKSLAPEVLDLLAAESEQLAEHLPEVRVALAGCMDKLKPADLEVVRLCYSPDVTVREAAEQLGRPLDTIKSVLKRARRQLYECIRTTLAKEERP